LISNVIVLIRTKKGRKPEIALREAVKKMSQRGKEIDEAFLKALEEWN
jgi:DNA-directed RNA polymerase subunit L